MQKKSVGVQRVKSEGEEGISRCWGVRSEGALGRRKEEHYTRKERRAGDRKENERWRKGMSER